MVPFFELYNGTLLLVTLMVQYVRTGHLLNSYSEQMEGRIHQSNR